MTFNRWADVYSARARQFTNPLDICEFYSDGQHYSDAWFRETTDRIAAQIELSPTDRVLEIGCGCGVLMKHLVSRAANFVGVDLAAGVLEVARRELPQVTFVEASADQLPFADGEFDKCYAYQTIHYFGDLETARKSLGEMRRVVRPGGKILLGQVPDADREAAYQQYRAARNVNRDQRVSHQLRWLWYAPAFFTALTDWFSEIRIERHERPSDPASPYRMDVVLTVR